MAVKKEEIASYFEKSELNEIEQLEKEIDKAICAKYIKGRAVIVPMGHLPSKRVRIELARRYNVAGWNVAFYDDQRDGASISLK